MGKKCKNRWTTSKYERLIRAHQNWHIRSCINIWNFEKSIESLNQKQAKSLCPHIKKWKGKNYEKMTMALWFSKILNSS